MTFTASFTYLNVFVDDIAADETSVSFENGLLHIVLPKLAADRNKKIFDIN